MEFVKFAMTIWTFILINTNVIALNTSSIITSRNSDSIFFETNRSGPWSEILENWIVSEKGNLNSRNSRVMKFGDKTLTISPKPNSPNKRDVSETDLYLLGAIEKLVYRVDYLEKRLRRAEELLYYVISGNNNNPKKEKEPCPQNYTRVVSNCYYFSTREFDWKSSASLCRGMGGNLVEFRNVEENQDIVAFLQTDKKFRGKNFWTGGLNPGLLWIWAASARPVYQDTKQTVTGDGRCLKLDFNPASRIYSYKGEDCGSRQRYICELTKDDESANKIARTARSLLHGN
ncbi:C-type lectin domain family 4 member A [Leptopilina boulardi]|uniref:C-type lectin domain family 4 member A n=1 Tax=Leptopilina boulardi TaxID=63433 RepID=UPI0021F54800|nr:C-type lectin domain family 4 member A [Leptopilina boulardi]